MKRRKRVDHAATIEALHEELTEKIRTLVTGDDWVAYLSQAQRFHRYSPNNQLLLALQGAEGHVASYRNWQRLTAKNGEPCQVAKGEKGLTVLAPMVTSVPDDEPADGEPKRRLLGFRPVKVFHQGQLVSPPDLADPAPPTLLEGTDRWPNVFAAVSAELADRGFDVELVDRQPGQTWNGLTNFTTRQVHVVGSMQPPQRLKTLLHEWAHIELGHEHPDGRAANVMEVEAESTAFLVAHTVGLNTGDYSIPYVARWAQADIDLIESTATRVLSATRALVRQLEQRLDLRLTVDPLELQRQQQLAEVSGREVLDAAAVHLESANVAAFRRATTRPVEAPKAASLLADAGFTATQTAAVLRSTQTDEQAIHEALLSPVDDPEVPTLYPETEVAAATQSSATAATDLAMDEQLLRRTILRAEPDRAAAMAYALGISNRDAIAICASATESPTKTFALAGALRKGDLSRAARDVAQVWPDPPGGWDSVFPSHLADERRNGLRLVDDVGPSKRRPTRIRGRGAGPSLPPLG